MSYKTFRSAGLYKIPEEPVQRCSGNGKLPPSICKMGKGRIIIKDYLKYKREIEEFCRKNLCGYEVRMDGTVVILVD